jgi:hypothetical protein
MPGRKTHPTIAQVLDLSDWDICGGGPIYSGSDAAEVVFPDLSDARADQFMYLFRRFGYPIHGGDPHKSLVDYFLTTPDPDVILWCKPASSLRWSFGVGISPSFYPEAYGANRRWMMQRGNRRPERWEDHPVCQRVHGAMCAAMTELLRPVRIRDVAYNILGRVEDGTPYTRWHAAERSHQAGYGLGDFDPAKVHEEAPK